ncbi:hypothetical protein ACFL34_01725 [Candidatus Sumerlaeota bacterium]
MKRYVWLIAVVVFCAFTAQAEVRMPSMFSDNMVLQRGKPVPIWDWADSGEKVTVEFAGQKKTTTANKVGDWLIRLDPMKASTESRRLRIVRFSGSALEEGIEKHEIEGVEVKVYCVAKTVADCFKYRNKIGLDVALEALREALRGRKCTKDEIWRYAKICRVANVMRPYREALA